MSKFCLESGSSAEEVDCGANCGKATARRELFDIAR
jgi:hypothetical protein